MRSRGDLGGRDKPHPRPVSLLACASLPPHLSLGSPWALPPRTRTQYCFFPQALLQECQTSQLTSRAQSAVNRSQGMEGRRRKRGRHGPQLFLHGGAVHSQGSGWMCLRCRAAPQPHSPTQGRRSSAHTGREGVLTPSPQLPLAGDDSLGIYQHER